MNQVLLHNGYRIIIEKELPRDLYKKSLVEKEFNFYFKNLNNKVFNITEYGLYKDFALNKIGICVVKEPGFISFIQSLFDNLLFLLGIILMLPYFFIKSTFNWFKYGSQWEHTIVILLLLVSTIILSVHISEPYFVKMAEQIAYNTKIIHDQLQELRNLGISL